MRELDDESDERESLGLVNDEEMIRDSLLKVENDHRDSAKIKDFNLNNQFTDEESFASHLSRSLASGTTNENGSVSNKTFTNRLADTVRRRSSSPNT